MEYIEGETLADRIGRGPLPVDEAIPLFIQIAEGLEAAHEKGIIHRDLKPANIKIGLDGKPKILDFGLAKAFAGEEAARTDSSQSPTLTKGTALGAIVGTPSYMSPEQAKGQDVDKRTDIFVFGCVLYECLTGKKAFEGETATETLGAIIRTEPDWVVLPANTPSNIRRLLELCFRKDARRRTRDIGDVALELELDSDSLRYRVAFAGKRSFLSSCSLSWSLTLPAHGARRRQPGHRRGSVKSSADRPWRVLPSSRRTTPWSRSRSRSAGSLKSPSCRQWIWRLAAAHSRSDARLCGSASWSPDGS